MKTSMTLPELSAAVQARAQYQRDFLADTRMLSVHPGPEGGLRGVLTLPDNGMEYMVTPHARGQLIKAVQIPGSYASLMQGSAPELLATNINHWLHNPKKPVRRLIRTEGPRIRAYLSDRYKPIDNTQLLLLLLPKLSLANQVHGTRFASLHVSDRRLTLKLVTHQLEAEIKEGDVIRGGISISNSEIGAGRLEIAPFTERLVCTNGLTVTDLGTAKTHLGRTLQGAGEVKFSDESHRHFDTLLVSMIGDAIDHCLSPQTFGEIADRMRGAASRKIVADIPATVEVTAKKYGLSAREKESVLDRLIRDANCDDTQFGLVNAVTRTAEDCEDYDRASELEAIGGNMLGGSKEWASLMAAATR